MYSNLFKVMWRHLLRAKGYSLINVGGLAIGMAVALLIALWIVDEVTFNRFFTHYDRIGSVQHHVDFGGEIITLGDTPAPLTDLIRREYTGFSAVTMTSWPKEHSFLVNDQATYRTGMFVEPSFANVFSLNLIEGSPTGLQNTRSILLGKSMSDVLFGGQSAVGKTLRIDNRDELAVVGVYQDFPTNTAFADVQFLLPMEYFFSLGPSTERTRNDWENYLFQCFVQLDDRASFDEASSRMSRLLYEHVSNDGKAIDPKGFILPMRDWHFRGEFKNGVSTDTWLRIVKMFGLTAIFVLMLASINFMNLSTARSEQRAKEVGIRKVIGSVRRQLITQFLGESLVMVSLAFILAIGIVALLLPAFNALTAKNISIPFTSIPFVASCLTFVAVTALLAGSYPALFLSSFSPVSVLKGRFKTGNGAVNIRRVMVVFQFTISTVLIVGTIVVYQQIQHAKERSAGFDLEGIFHIPVRTLDLGMTDYNTLRQELLATGVVDNMAKSDFPITGSMSGDASISWPGKDPAFRPLIALNSCSHDFPQTSGFQFVEGRDFDRARPSDSLAIIVNEMAAKLISSESVIGTKITFGSGRQREVIGVIRDQVRWSPFTKQSPHMYYIRYEELGYITVRLKSGVATADALARVEKVLKAHAPAAPFEYKFVDDDYARLFAHEERVGRLASVFAVLTIFISCIGILGLSSFSASRREKEIGVRKVLGASVLSIWQLLSRDYLRLVFIAALIAIPVSYFFTTKWLSQYEYRTELSWWVFIATAGGTLVVTLATVSYQSIKAAVMNPVRSLRSE